MSEATPALIQSMLDAMPDAAILVARDLRVAGLNRPAAVLFPTMRAGDLLVRSFRATEMLDALARLFAGEGAQSAAWRDRVPVERQFEIRINPLVLEPFGACALATLRDVMQARALDRMRADFVANASHELRTPLASLLGFIETLQGPARADAAAREKFLGVMADQARRMARLIDDLLSLSRVEQHQHVAPQERIDLAAIAREMVDNLRPMAQSAGVSLELHAPEPAWIAGDRDEMLRAAENLIENAIKYGAGSPVEVRVERDGEACRLSVADRGPGIEPRHIPRLTERFYRIDTSASRARGGTGLGLAIVKHIVARHRGRLGIESAPGAGARFTIAVPHVAD